MGVSDANTEKVDMKLNLGCGEKLLEGWVNIDISSKVGADVVMDMEEVPWPFDDNSVDEIHCYHVLEHCKDYLKVLGEMYRVCRHDATIRIGVPHVMNSLFNLVNPYHHNYFNEHSFRFFDSDDLKGTANEAIEVELKTESVRINYFTPWQDKSDEEKEFALRHYWNVARSVDFVLRVVKRKVF